MSYTLTPLEVELLNIVHRIRINERTPSTLYVGEILAVIDKYKPQCIGCAVPLYENNYCRKCNDLWQK